MTHGSRTPHVPYEVFRVKTGEIVAPDVSLSIARVMIAAADTEMDYRRVRQNTEPV